MLLEHDRPFNFDEGYLKAFDALKKAFATIPIIIVPNWSLPFELTCDSSDYSDGVVLGKSKIFNSIYYANKSLTNKKLTT